jgi:hypothetical protein
MHIVQMMNPARHQPWLDTIQVAAKPTKARSTLDIAGSDMSGYACKAAAGTVKLTFKLTMASGQTTAAALSVLMHRCCTLLAAAHHAAPAACC